MLPNQTASQSPVTRQEKSERRDQQTNQLHRRRADVLADASGGWCMDRGSQLPCFRVGKKILKLVWKNRQIRKFR